MSAEVAPTGPLVVTEAPTAPALVATAHVSAKTLLKGSKNTASGTNIEMSDVAPVAPKIDDAALVISDAPIKLGTRYTMPFIYTPILHWGAAIGFLNP
jgi:hypothetical protein